MERRNFFRTLGLALAGSKLIPRELFPNEPLPGAEEILDKPVEKQVVHTSGWCGSWE